MTLRLKTFLMSLIALFASMLLAIAPVQAKPAVDLDQITQKSALGGYQLYEQVESEDEAPIRLASLGNFGWSAETVSEYANATNRAALDDEIDGTRNLGDPNAGVVNTDRVRPVNGRTPINSQQYAGTTMRLDGDIGQRYPHGVPFTGSGFPDFSRYAQTNVRIELTGSRAQDFAAANRAAGYSRTPSGMTWHHHQDAGYMQLIPTDLHNAVRHTGGVATSGITPYQ